MAKSSAENVVKTTIIAADGTAQGAKQAKDTIQKTVGGIKPVEVKADVKPSSMAAMRSKISGHFTEMFSAVAIGTLIADGVKFAFKTAMEEVFKSVELWDVFESSAKRAFAGAQAQGFRGDFDQFASAQLKNINAISMVYGVQQTQLENAAALLSRVFKPDQVQNMMAGLAKLQMVTGKSAEDWASLIVKVNGGAFQAKKLVEMGIQVPKGFTGEEQGEVVVNLLNDYIRKMTRQDTSFLTQDMPIDQITAMADGLKLSVGAALDETITDVITSIRDEIVGGFGSMEEIGKTIAGSLIQIVRDSAPLFGFFRVIGNIVTIVYRAAWLVADLIVGVITGFFGALPANIFTWATGMKGWDGFAKNYMLDIDKDVRKQARGIMTDFSDIGGAFSNYAYDPTQNVKSQTAKTGADKFKAVQDAVEEQARNMPSIGYNKSVFAKEEAKPKAQSKVVIQMPYGMRPAFSNSYAPASSTPMRRY